MVSDKRRALVVDDEVAIRNLVSGALRQAGFECETTADGVQAIERLEQSNFDVLVTDLRMPNKNGHALALDALKQPNRPVIIVYTGVIEPKLAKDLLARGVDDFLFKPLDINVLTAKVKSLVERRPATSPDKGGMEGSAQNPAVATQEPEDNSDVGPIGLTRLNARLAELSRVLPVSNAAIDVYEMTRSYDWEVAQIAAAIQRDASLAAEVLRLANGALYNQSGRRIINLDEAVLRIGQKRVGELALTANALASFAPGLLPWLDLELMWKRSMAAGIIVEALIEAGGHQAIEEGLLLSAIMHPLGRVALGMLFPQHYEAMIERSTQCKGSLQEEERSVFPTTHTEVMAHLLATWRIPRNVFLPLKFVLDDFSTLARLSEPARTRAELVKVAAVLGRLAAGRWDNWDLVQLPPARILKRLRLKNAGEIIRQTRSDLSKLAEFRPGGQGLAKRPKESNDMRPVVYCNVAENPDDVFFELLPSLGFEPEPCSLDELKDVERPCVVNCLGSTATRFAARGAANNTVIFTEDDNRDVLMCLAPTIGLPNSFAYISETLHKELKRKHAAQPVMA